MTFRSAKFQLTLMRQILQKDNFVKIINKPSNVNPLELTASDMSHRFVLVVVIIEKISWFVPKMINDGEATIVVKFATQVYVSTLVLKYLVRSYIVKQFYKASLL